MSPSAQLTHDDTPTSRFNPLLFNYNMQQTFEVWQDILRLIAQEDSFATLRKGDPSLWQMAGESMQWMANAMQDPTRMMQLGYVWLNDSANLWQESMQRFLSVNKQDDDNALSSAKTSDKRFADEAWQENGFFHYIKQQYLMTSSWMQDAIARLDDDTNPHSREKINFYTQQWLDAMAPSNFAITNPEVLKTTLESNGENLLKGLKNLREDFERGQGKLAISTTDKTAFEVGKNLAATEGKVVFQNDLLQLIQYAPLTKKVYKTPMLLIPAWINKFYIFDMQQKNSFVRWLVEQGQTVFVISWVNPTAKHRNKTFDDYMCEGLLASIEAVKDICACDKVNAVGYCLGGTLLASTLAYLHAKGEESQIASATYLTTMIDFSEPGELGVFIDEDQIQALEAKMEKSGYLDGSHMATTFSMLRSNNMIWSFMINNYLLGKEPFPFDLLYWNADSTRMPATTHSFYLRTMYKDNKLANGEMELAGETIDVTRITTPSFILSTREDHIAPWTSTYLSTQLYSGDIRFVLAGSGHIAGVINPPTKEKYGYWTGGHTKGVSATDWFDSASHHPGSWWPQWHDWQRTYNTDDMIDARECGNARYAPIEDAPGSYVLVK